MTCHSSGCVNKRQIRIGKHFIGKFCSIFIVVVKNILCWSIRILSNFFGHFVDLQEQIMMTSDSMVSQKSTFPNWGILYINQKIIHYWSFSTRGRRCLLGGPEWKKFFWTFCGSSGADYDDVRFYGQPKINLSKLGHIIYQSKDNSLLIIFY